MKVLTERTAIKMKKVIIIVAVLLAVAVIGGFALPSFFADELIRENTTVTASGADEGTYIISHVTENGEKIGCSFSCDTTEISEDCCKYTFLFNQDNLDGNYDIYSISLNLDSGSGISVYDAFVSEGGSAYRSVDATGETIEFTSAGNYMHVTMLVYKEVPDVQISAVLRYSIKGNGVYSKNRFTGIEHNFTL